MDAIFRFPAARRTDPGVEAWFAGGDALREIIKPWFERFRTCGSDVRELIHDGRPTACARDAAFAYVDAFAEHANIGFFFGAFLADPAGLMEGGGKRMRHVTVRISRMPDESALNRLITAAYRDVHKRLANARS